ncbi:hypothetical protein GM921_09865 [Pedobacter sp. LMG 31464]|uniref:Uncharacterized protein n=1 Tax=Pedobacter planticolens TaxID=2679964 RepID=A0A923DZT0_9SPHI|nr:hypothetical protein [Pedobacter planticolens]MBB2145793.1 hypothetical protein [Pedobacter planticolens]
MKNKKVMYGLLVVVVIVWGIIGYRVFMASGSQELPPVQAALPKREYVQLINHENDTVNLDLAYRDPFSVANGDFIAEAAGNAVGLKNPAPALLMPRTGVNWSTIQYMGYITNPDTKLKVVLISLNGKDLMLAEGQSLNGLRLIKYTGDSVKIEYQKESKYLKLN